MVGVNLIEITMESPPGEEESVLARTPKDKLRRRAVPSDCKTPILELWDKFVAETTYGSRCSWLAKILRVTKFARYKGLGGYNNESPLQRGTLRQPRVALLLSMADFLQLPPQVLER